MPPVSALAVHRSLPGWLYAGTDVGVFMSTDNGQTWQTQNDGPGNVPVEQLLWKDDHSLLAVTHGRGMYVASETTSPITGRKLLDGVVIAGTLGDTATSDDQYYQLGPSPTTNPLKQKIDMLAIGNSPTAAPSIFQFRVQAKMNGGPMGDVMQEIMLLNVTTGDYDLQDTSPVATSDGTIVVLPTGDASRYVHPVTKEVTARVRWSSPAFAGSTFTWTIDVDEAVWLIAE